MKIQLTQNEYNLLFNNIKGQGGFQTLQKKLQGKTNGNSEIILTEEDMEQICRYVKKYGTGGAQTKFLNIFENYLECFNDKSNSFKP
jgi:hypothetical protein